MSFDDFAHVCIYGDPKTGKTTAAASLANLGPTAFFMAEPGMKKVALKRRGINVDNIGPVVTGFSCETLINSFWKLKAALEKDPNAYAGSVLDTATIFVNREVSRIRKREYALETARAAGRGEVYEKTAFWTSRDYFGEMTVEVREVLESFMDLPMHLCWTAHTRRDVDEKSGLVSYGPATTPAVQQDIAAYMDIILRTERVGPFFIGHTVQHGDKGEFMAGDRLDILPTPVMAEPSMERIVGYLKGELTTKNDEIQKAWVAHVTGKGK